MVAGQVDRSSIVVVVVVVLVVVVVVVVVVVAAPPDVLAISLYRRRCDARRARSNWSTGNQYTFGSDATRLVSELGASCACIVRRAAP